MLLSGTSFGISRLFLGYKKEPKLCNEGCFRVFKGVLELPYVNIFYKSSPSKHANHPFNANKIIVKQCGQCGGPQTRVVSSPLEHDVLAGGGGFSRGRRAGSCWLCSNTRHNLSSGRGGSVTTAVLLGGSVIAVVPLGGTVLLLQCYWGTVLCSARLIKYHSLVTISQWWLRQRIP